MRSRYVLTVIGVAVAAFLLATNPVVSNAAAQITGKQIKNNSVTGKDIKDASLLAGDFKAGQLPAGTQGPQGPQGPQGVPGIAGSARAYGFVDIDTTSGDYVLRAGSKGVVAIANVANPAACIQLDPSIDASTAVTIAVPNFRTGATTAWNTHVEISSPLAYCGSTLPNVVEVVTTDVDFPGAAVNRAFVFAVM